LDLGSATARPHNTISQIDLESDQKSRVRPLTIEQLYFSLVRATSVEKRLSKASRKQGQQIQQAIFPTFSFVFDDDEGKEEQDFARSIPQGLFLMNGQLDPAVAALIDDLKASGKLDETLIVWVGDFGRTPRIDTGMDAAKTFYTPQGRPIRIVYKDGRIVKDLFA